MFVVILGGIRMIKELLLLQGIMGRGAGGTERRTEGK
jgi:hypothetical protein